MTVPTMKTLRDARYDAKSSRRYGLKLNVKTDAALIERLEAVGSVNGYIRRLIREDIARNPQPPTNDSEPFEE